MTPQFRWRSSGVLQAIENLALLQHHDTHGVPHPLGVLAEERSLLLRLIFSGSRGHLQ
jgi:hypothetical protein